MGIRRVFKKLQYQYRDRRQRRRVFRREWIQTINAGCREHNVRYSRFIAELNRSNIKLDRKILANLAVNEPYSFKATLDQVMLNNSVAGAFVDTNKDAVTFKQAMKQNLLSFKIPEKEPEIPEISIIGFLNPEDAKTDKDFYRISFKEEDKKWLE